MKETLKQKVISEIKERLAGDFEIRDEKDEKGNIVLADEITPDSCRLWDKKTGKKMDKDIFRQDLGDLKSAYQEVLKRIVK